MNCPECGSEDVKEVMVDANIKSEVIARHQCTNPSCSYSFQVTHNAKRGEEGPGGVGAGPVPIRSLIPDSIPCDRCRNQRASIVTIDPNTGRVRRMCLMCKIYVFGALP